MPAECLTRWFSILDEEEIIWGGFKTDGSLLIPRVWVGGGLHVSEVPGRCQCAAWVVRGHAELSRSLPSPGRLPPSSPPTPGGLTKVHGHQHEAPPPSAVPHTCTQLPGFRAYRCLEETEAGGDLIIRGAQLSVSAPCGHQGVEHVTTHFPSFPPPSRLVWNHLLHTSSLREASIFLHFPGSWRGPSAFPRLIHEARPRQPLPDQLQACTNAAMLARPVFTWKGKAWGPSSLWSNLAHLSPTLGTGRKLAQCPFIYLTLTLLCVPQGRGSRSGNGLYCWLNPMPSPPFAPNVKRSYP